MHRYRMFVRLPEFSSIVFEQSLSGFVRLFICLRRSASKSAFFAETRRNEASHDFLIFEKKIFCLNFSQDYFSFLLTLIKNLDSFLVAFDVVVAAVVVTAVVVVVFAVM